MEIRIYLYNSPIKNNKMKIETKKLENINGKELLYVVIENESAGRANINVGKKTFDAINELIIDEKKQAEKIRETETKGKEVPKNK